MFDTMTLTKIVGAFCGALLVFLMGGWVAETLYHTGGGHGDEYTQAYVIDTGESETEEADAEPEVPFAEIYASADAAKGEKDFRPCAACHKVTEGDNATGPFLHGVVGRAKASVPGFNYSSALTDLGGDWTPEDLSHFLHDPKGYAPGTKMSFKGYKDVKDAANVVAYLATLTN